MDPGLFSALGSYGPRPSAGPGLWELWPAALPPTFGWGEPGRERVASARGAALGPAKPITQ
jgi:hypothetical protein